MPKKILIVGDLSIAHIQRFMNVLHDNIGDEFIVDIFNTQESLDRAECKANRTYFVETHQITRWVYRLRKIGSILREFRKAKCLEKILKENRYDLVDIHMPTVSALRMVELSHRFGAKTLLTPLGSDVLRVKKVYLPILKKAYAKTDFVNTNMTSGFYHKILSIMNVDSNKFLDLRYGSTVITSILKLRGKYSKSELAEALNLPQAKYYICCAFNASRAQRHSVILDALAANRERLPEGTQIVIPLTYGSEKFVLRDELTEQCKRLNLKATILTDFMTDDNVAMLRLISDMMIHIQTTDADSGSLVESLLAGTTVVNGKWLEYPQLEKYGYPYYLCDAPETLAETLCDVFEGRAKKTELDSRVEEEIASCSWNHRIKAWVYFFKTV
jgi:hypothetical protein